MIPKYRICFRTVLQNKCAPVWFIGITFNILLRKPHGMANDSQHNKHAPYVLPHHRISIRMRIHLNELLLLCNDLFLHPKEHTFIRTEHTTFIAYVIHYNRTTTKMHPLQPQRYGDRWVCVSGLRIPRDISHMQYAWHMCIALITRTIIFVDRTGDLFRPLNLGSYGVRNSVTHPAFIKIYSRTALQYVRRLYIDTIVR